MGTSDLNRPNGGARATSRWAIHLLVASAIVLMAGRVGADGGPIYQFVDADGTVHFSDIPFKTRSLTGRRILAPELERGFEISPRPKSPPTHSGYDAVIARVSDRYRVQPALVKAVVAAESNFNAAAVSHKGAQGLMQLMPFTAKDMGVSDPLVPEENISGGVRYLRAMLDRYGDVDRALAAYNAGPTAVDRYAGVPPYPETQAYVKRVLKYYRGYWGDF